MSDSFKSPRRPKPSPLRERAEKCFREMVVQSPEQADVLAPDNLHELRVHQIELEMQNDELRRAQADLEESRARYFDLYDMAPVGYCTVSESGMILEPNLTAAALLGIGRSALIGRPLTGFILNADQDIYYRHRNRLFETGEPQTCDLRMLRPDGTTFWAHLKANAGGKTNGAPVCRVVLSDITWRKQAEQMLREREIHLGAVLEAAADGILAVDNTGKVIRANRRFLEIWGIPEPLIKGGDDRALLDFVLSQLADPDGFIEKVRSLYDSDEESFDTVAFKDARIIERYSFAMILDGTRIGRVWSFRDVTARNAMEDRLGEAVLRAEAALGAKSWFLAMVSHELRSPLSGVVGYADLLAASPLDEEQKSYVRTIIESSNHLLLVVNDILDFSSIENGTLAIQTAPFSIAGLVESSAAASRKDAADKGLAFRCEVAADVPERIVGDERRIRQILINLFANAVKFTSSGSVVLRIAVASVDGPPALDFSVEDTGIGIASEAIGHMFQPFTQASAKIGHKYGGNGLGLTISKHLAEAMGGSLTVVSQPGQGCTFTFRLPLVRA